MEAQSDLCGASAVAARDGEAVSGLEVRVEQDVGVRGVESVLLDEAEADEVAGAARGGEGGAGLPCLQADALRGDDVLVVEGALVGGGGEDAGESLAGDDGLEQTGARVLPESERGVAVSASWAAAVGDGGDLRHECREPDHGDVERGIARQSDVAWPVAEPEELRACGGRGGYDAVSAGDVGDGAVVRPPGRVEQLDDDAGHGRADGAVADSAGELGGRLKREEQECGRSHDRKVEGLAAFRVDGHASDDAAMTPCIKMSSRGTSRYLVVGGSVR